MFFEFCSVKLAHIYAIASPPIYPLQVSRLLMTTGPNSTVGGPALVDAATAKSYADLVGTQNLLFVKHLADQVRVFDIVFNIVLLRTPRT
jgi:hypothetical protein